MSYRDTARAYAQITRPDPTANNRAAADHFAAGELPLSEWAEARRESMTPQTVAANHALHVSDTAHELRQTIAAIRERSMWAGGLLADRAAALLAAIGEGEDQ